MRDPRVTRALVAPRPTSCCVLFPLSLLAAPFARSAARVPRFFPRSVRDLAASTALVDLAGVSFIDGREKFLPFNILTILPAMLLGTPVFKLAQAMGPFKHPLNRLAARLLRHCALVVPRGDVTLSHMDQIAFPRRPHVSRRPTSRSCSVTPTRSRSRASRRPTSLAETARSARGLRARGRRPVPERGDRGQGGRRGLGLHRIHGQLAEGLLDDGHAVLLFPNATRAGSEKLRNNDLPVIAQIAERFGDGTSACSRSKAT